MIGLKTITSSLPFRDRKALRDRMAFRDRMALCDKIYSFSLETMNEK